MCYSISRFFHQRFPYMPTHNNHVQLEPVVIVEVRCEYTHILVVSFPLEPNITFTAPRVDRFII